MKTNQPLNLKVLILLVAITLLTIMTVTLTSCSGTRKASGKQLESPPPPPPPVAAKSEEQMKVVSMGQIPSRYYVYGSDTVYYYIKEMPHFPGKEYELPKFQYENLKTPTQVLEAGFEGNVMVNFLVGKDGRLSDFTIGTGVSPTIDAEALRVARLMPKWIPGTENGKPVITKTGIIFNFYAPFSDQAIQHEVFVVVEEMPRFPGGDTALIRFIKNSIQYPKEARDKGIQGRVILRFCVTYLGGVDRVGVIKGVNPQLDAEAVRVIKMSPSWQPGRQGGKPVNVWYSVPVTFSLKGPDKPVPVSGENVAPPPPPPPPMPPLIYGFDEPPQFPDGEIALIRFINSSIIYPQGAKDKKISGTVLVRCTIDETGKPGKAAIMSGLDSELDAEALRVVNLMPDWKPGKLKGKPVSVTYTIPVRFKL